MASICQCWTPLSIYFHILLLYFSTIFLNHISEQYFCSILEMTFLQLRRPSSLDCALDQPPYHASIANVHPSTQRVSLKNWGGVATPRHFFFVASHSLTVPQSWSWYVVGAMQCNELGSGDPDELAVVGAMQCNTMRRISRLMN